MLLSPTFFTKMISEYNLYPVPKITLERKRDIGSQTMELLETMFKEKSLNVDRYFYNESVKNRVSALIQWFIENNIEIHDVEKFITDGTWCGSIDVVAKWRKSNVNKANWCIFEIKCRNSVEVRYQDKIQMETYYKMMHLIPVYLLIIDDNLKITCIKRPMGKQGTQLTLSHMLNAYNRVLDNKLPAPTKIEIIS